MKPINWVFSFISGILALIILLFLAVALTFNHWVPHVAPWLLGPSGFELQVGKSQSNVFTMRLDFRNLAIRNGEDFPVPQFLEVEQFRTDLLLLSLLTKKVVVEDFTLHIPRLTYVKNGDGQVNVGEFLRAVLPSSKKSGEKEKKASKTASRKIVFQNFDFSMGTVVLMDYTANPVKVMEIPVNYSFHSQNVDADTLLKKITGDLRARGVIFLMESLLHSLVHLPDFSPIIQPILKVNGLALEGIGDGVRSGKNFFQKVKAKFR
jgi:hypothetical protein